MQIFEAEKELSDLILRSNSIAFCSFPLEHDNSPPLNLDIATDKYGNIDDLFLAKNIYVTVGWNRNDDIFEKEETWKARKTPINKPFNIQHEPRRIIGHIVDSFGYTLDHNKIDDNISINELPDVYHLVIQSFIYRAIPCDQRDPELNKEREQIINEIMEGQWYVSMECIFDSFDYGIEESNGDQLIIGRNDDTAFLTKYLRAYGGDGSYRGRKIGRVVRNLTFIGNGLVKQPANPNSVFIFAEENIRPFKSDKRVSSLSTIYSDYVQGDDLMSKELLDEYKAKIASLEEKLAQANEELQKTSVEHYQEEITKMKEDLESANAKISDLSDKCKSLEEEKEQIKADLSNANGKIQQYENDLKEANAKVLEMQIEAKKVDRVSTLISKGADKEYAQSIADKFIDIDDEKFNDIVKMQEKILAAENAASNSNENEDEDENAQVNAEDILNDVDEADDDPNLSSASDNRDEEANQRRVALANDIAEYLRNRSRKSK